MLVSVGSLVGVVVVVVFVVVVFIRGIGVVMHVVGIGIIGSIFGGVIGSIGVITRMSFYRGRHDVRPVV